MGVDTPTLLDTNEDEYRSATVMHVRLLCALQSHGLLLCSGGEERCALNALRLLGSYMKTNADVTQSGDAACKDPCDQESGSGGMPLAEEWRDALASIIPKAWSCVFHPSLFHQADSHPLIDLCNVSALATNIKWAGQSPQRGRCWKENKRDKKKA